MVTWIILIICSYLLGAVPSSYLAARSRGIDLRKQGSSQMVAATCGERLPAGSA